MEEELDKLLALDLVETTKDGNRRYYSANRSHPWHTELCGIVLKSSGLSDVLRTALGTERTVFAFVFGSLTATAESDVDLMVIGRVGLRDLAPRLRGAAGKIGREITPPPIHGRNSRNEPPPGIISSAMCSPNRSSSS